MDDREKFEALKIRLVSENERQYGDEARALYGEEAVRQSGEKLMGLTPEGYDAMKALEMDIRTRLEEAVRAGKDPDSECGEAIVCLHRQWLSYTLPHYSRETHLGIASLYTQDERFTAYYDREVPGCAAFLRDAVTAALS